jgi:LCP family protein required for cell wall assembly
MLDSGAVDTEVRRPGRPVQPPTRSPSAAIALSFLWPGLGQLFTGRGRAALLFAAPLLLVVLVVLFQALGGLTGLAAALVAPSTALTLAILIALLGLWRVLSMADAANGAVRGRSWFAGVPAVVFVTLTALIVVTHVWAGYVAWAVYDASSRIFVGDADPDRTPDPTNDPDASPTPLADPADEFRATPFAEPSDDRARINVLLTGIDSAATRTHSLTDTMIVVSVDPDDGDIAMVSFPRDLSDFPLYNGKTYSGKLNSLMTWARNHPKDYPDGPLPTLAKELGFLLGVPIHYYAAVDLAGFKRLVDAVGGVTVNVEKSLNDPRYDWLDGRRGFSLKAGKQTLDGETALAYVRSRFSAGDNDFGRARRQQQVLLAVREKLTTPAMLPKVPELLDVAGDNIRTNFPSARVGQMLDLAAGLDDGGVQQVVLGPPYSYHPPTNTTGGIYKLRFHMDKLEALSIKLFGADSAYAE